jgi:uncharacterized membrane protein YeiH
LTHSIEQKPKNNWFQYQYMDEMITQHFTLHAIFDLGAVFVFGITGALAAVHRGYDFIGLFALAFVTGVGGGLIRDSVFIQHGPPAVATDWRYFFAILLSGIVGLLFHKKKKHIGKIIAFFDAVGLGAYAVVGVQKALAASLSIPASIMVGVINAAGGGLLRDILVSEEPLLFKPGQLYVLAALAGCLLFIVLAVYFGIQAEVAALVTIVFTFILRVLAIKFNWSTKPLYRSGGEE